MEEPAQAPPPPPAIEKVTEEDKRRPHPLKRVLYKIFPFLEKSAFEFFYITAYDALIFVPCTTTGEELRIVTANDRIGNAGYKYAVRP